MSLSFRVESTNKRFDASSWVQVYEFGPQDEETKKSKGYLICAIRVTIKDKESLVEPSTYGKRALSSLHQNYYGALGKSAFNSLVSALGAVYPTSNNDSIDISISCLVSVADVTYVGTFGESRVSILRNGVFANILVGSTVPAAASGFPRNGDVVILSVGGATKIDNSESLTILSKGLTFESNQEIGQLLDSGGETYALGLVGFGNVDYVELEDGDTDIDRPSSETTKTEKNRFFGEIIRKITQRRITIKEDGEEVSKQKRPILIVGILIIVLLIVSMVFGMLQKTKTDEMAKYVDRLSKAEADYQTAIDLYGVSMSESRSKFLSSKQLSDELIAEGVEDERLNTLKSKISENEGKITGDYQIEPQLFVDLSLLSDDFGGKEMSTGETELYILSSAGDRVASVDFPGKRSEIVVGPKDIKEAIKIANFNENVFNINSEGLFDASENDKIQDKYWEGDALLYSYGGNIYLLDKSKSIIYRHSATDSGYADQSEWTKEDQERDLSQINSWSIDGLVWLLSSSGKIAKYSQGVEQNFSINGLPSEFTNPADIYTNENINNLYVLDPTNSRVVVITKDGEYVASYVDQTLNNAKKVSVSEKDKLMLILLEGKVYSLELRHLANL